MILNIISMALFFIYLILGVIHFYWAFGGEWAIKNAIPTNKENEHIHFRPGTLATLVVSIVLLSFSAFYLFQNDFMNIKLPEWTNYMLWIIPTLFSIRSIGDFKYVGFFKSIKSTLFAKWDKKLYSPLCLIVGVFGFIIFYLNY